MLSDNGLRLPTADLIIWSLPKWAIWAEYRLRRKTIVPYPKGQFGTAALGERRAGSWMTDPEQQGVLNVRKSRLLAALAASVVLSLVIGLDAQAQPAARAPAARAPAAPAAPAARAPAQGQPVALIDVGRVMKSYNRHKIEEDRLKAEMQQAENWVKTERESLRKMLEQLKEYQPGTPQYNQQEAAIAQRNATVTTQIKLQQKKFQIRSADITLKSYREIRAETSAYANHYGIAMVQRFSADPANSTNPSSVVKKIYGQVVWHNAQLDITDVVIDWLNKRNQGPRPGENPNTVRRTGVDFGGNRMK